MAPMRVIGRSTGFGAEVTGLTATTLAYPVSELQEALREHAFLVLRGQAPTPEDLARLAAVWGMPEAHPSLPRAPGTPVVAVLESGPHTERSAESWHFDASWGQPTPIAILLHGRELPSRGGDTLVLDARAAAGRLLDLLGPQVQSATVDHGRRGSASGVEERRMPLIAPHPVTGVPVLRINPAHVHRLECVGADGQTLVPQPRLESAVHQVLDSEDLVARFTWSPGSILIWDNRACLHKVEYDFLPERRVMERVSVVTVREDSVAASAF